jgi:hypothetical protein
MAISIDYSNPAQFVINIPKADTTFITSSPSEIRQLNINDLRLWLADLQDDAEGQHFPPAFVHTPPLTVGGVTLARVVEILSPYTIQFEDGTYSVNIVGGNSNVSDVNIKNQVGVNTANSAGLQDPFSLQAASFANEVTIDTVNGTAGTTFPKGTRGFPVDNLADAKTIADSRGIVKFKVIGTLTLGSGDFSDGYIFEGDNPVISSVVIQSAPNVTNCTFQRLNISGELDGNNTFAQSDVGNVNMFDGLIVNSGLAGTVTLGGNSVAQLVNCYSSIPGGGPAAYPVIDMGGAASTDLLVRDYHGGLGIANCTDATIVASIDLSSGRVIFASDVSAGAYTVRGIADVTDNSTGTATVTDATVNCGINKTRKHSTNKMVTDPVTGVATLYDDDGVTPLETSQFYEDAAGLQTYRGQGAERREGFS